MNVSLLNWQNQEIDNYSPDKIELLINAPFSNEAHDELDRLHRARYRLRCECMRILHVVQWTYPFLRRNPRQKKKGPQCALCESDSLSNSRAGSFTVPEEESGIGLILATRQHQKKSSDKTRVKGSSGGTHKQKYQRAFTVLYTLMERAGFTSLCSPLNWGEIWERMNRQLQVVALHHESSHSLADFAWLPGSISTGGLAGLNRRMRVQWDHPKMKAEGWVFGILQEPPSGGEVKLYASCTSMRRSLESNGSQVFSYNFQIPRYSMTKVGRTGPYFMLAVCSPDLEGNPQYTKPNFHRLILQSILSEKCPIPVESNFEREVAVLLLRRQLPFRKPVFSREGVRPDFVLPQHEVIIEVQGMNDEEYRERKQVIHERIRSSESYARFRLVTYDANEGENLSDFESKLMRLLK